MLLFAQWILFLNGEGPFRIGNSIQWGKFGTMALGAAFALILADILLDRLVDNRLR
jgi:hypothetical protein